LQSASRRQTGTAQAPVAKQTDPRAQDPYKRLSPAATAVAELEHAEQAFLVASVAFTTQSGRAAVVHLVATLEALQATAAQAPVAKQISSAAQVP